MGGIKGVRVVEINVSCNSGSIGRIADQIAMKLKEYGAENLLIHGSRYVGLSKIPNICSQPRILDYVHGLYSMIFDKHGLGSYFATKRVIKEIQHFSPNIIHLHNIHGYYLNYAVLFDYLKKFQIPVVWTLHDCWPFTGHCVYFDYIQCSKWQQECNNCPNIRSYPSSLFIDNSRENFKRKKHEFCGLGKMIIVPVSQWMEDNVKRSFLSAYPTRVIRNGIDIQTFVPSDYYQLQHNLKIEDKKVVLGVASPFIERKGYSDFIKLRGLLSDAFVTILVGVSCSQIRQLPEGIIGIERTESIKKLCQFYSMADVFLNLTYEDNFPTVNLEAMACGTPVITYNTGGSPESITERTGMVVEKGNLDSVVDAIQVIVDKGKKFYSDACRANVMTRFNAQDRFEEYIKLYQGLLDKSLDTHKREI